MVFGHIIVLKIFDYINFKTYKVVLVILKFLKIRLHYFLKPYKIFICKSK
jgi:hypothetical protein